MEIFKKNRHEPMTVSLYYLILILKTNPKIIFENLQYYYRVDVTFHNSLIRTVRFGLRDRFNQQAFWELFDFRCFCLEKSRYFGLKIDDFLVPSNYDVFFPFFFHFKFSQKRETLTVNVYTVHLCHLTNYC